MKKKILIALLCLALALCLAACGTDSPGEAASGPGETAPEETGMAFVFDWEGSCWSEDHSVYTTSEQAVTFQLKGLEPGEIYRPVVLGMDLGGEIFASGFTNDCIIAQADGTGSYTLEYLVFGDGTYRELTLAVIGTEQQISHTFTLELSGSPQADSSSRLLACPEIYKPSWFYSAEEIQLENQIYEVYREDLEKALEGNTLRIAVPSQDAVYTGSAGDSLSVTMIYETDLQASVRLENVETGAVIEEWRNVTFTNHYISLSIDCEDHWTPGRYRLTISQEDVILDSVEFTMEEDNRFQQQLATVRQQVEERLAGKTAAQLHTYDASQLTGEQLLAIRKPQSGLWLYSYSYDDSSYQWSSDLSAVTCTYGGLNLQIQGMVPGVPYYAAVMGYDIMGNSFLCYMPVQRYEAGSDHGSTYLSSSLTSLPGTYRDLTVAIIGGNGDSYAMTFDYTYAPEEGRSYSNYLSGALVGNASSYYEDPLIYPDGYDDDTETLISMPLADTAYYGYNPTTKLGFRVNPDKVEEGNYVITLVHVESGTLLGSIQRTAQELRDGNGSYWQGNSFDLTARTEGPCLLQVTRDGETVETVEFSIHWDLTLRSQFLALLPEQSAAQAQVSTISIAQELLALEQDMTVLETDAFEGFLRYRYTDPTQTGINSFAICSPNVKATEVSVDQEDYLHTANWALRDFYDFEQRDRIHYSDTPVLDLAQVNDLHGESWMDLTGLTHLTGLDILEDGTQCVWIPVYYEDENGGILNDQMYLFAYLLYPGADDAYLADLNYFNPELYHEYHITRMLITDQEQVVRLLTKLRGDGSFGVAQTRETDYPEISADSYFYNNAGMKWFLGNLQTRLRELGYLTQSTASDSCDSVTTAAIRAYETANGLTADGVADNEMQQLLFSGAEEQQFLAAWLDAYEGKE